jgi:hypothetical protein
MKQTQIQVKVVEVLSLPPDMYLHLMPQIHAQPGKSGGSGDIGDIF